MGKFSSNKKIPITFAVNDIRILDRKLPDKDTQVDRSDLKYTLSFKFKKEENLGLVAVELEYAFMSKGEVIHTISTFNEYKLSKSDLKKIESNPDAQDRFFIHLADLSLNHSRALQATIIDGTPIKGMFIPIIESAKLKSLLK